MKKKKIGFAIMACFASLLFFCGVPLGNLYYSMATVNAAYMGEVSTAKQEADRLQSESAAAEAKKAEEEAKKQAEEDIKTQEEERKRKAEEVAAAAKEAAKNIKPTTSYEKPSDEVANKEDGMVEKPSGGDSVVITPPTPDNSGSDESSNGDSGSSIPDGWRTIDGNRYYYSGNKPLTGWQNINGVRYVFDDSGKQTSVVGIDVSKYQGNIDWAQVKAAGVDFAMIRLGYRGSGTGVLVEDPYFEKNIKGAYENGIKVGVYFFSQALNEQEAIEEASFCLSYLKKMGQYKITYPVAIDVEDAYYTVKENGKDVTYPGRMNGLSKAQYTANVNAFSETIKAAGYTPMVYANGNWLTYKLDRSQIWADIWMAHYTSDTQTSYNYGYKIWQYTSKATIPGIKGNVDMNIGLKRY